MTEHRRQFALDVVTRLREAGFQAYWAGGCVRDLLLGRNPSDFDVATDARPEQVGRLFRRTAAVGASFGVVRVLGPHEAGDVEVATFRTDGTYSDGRRPDSVAYGSIEDDAARRDFTVNGMFLDPTTDRVIDFVGGRADLFAKVLRAIGDPAARFAEDKLRLLRAVRFAARFGLTIEPATAAAIRSMAGEVAVVAAERIAQELRKILVDPSRVVALDLLRDLGLLPASLPGLNAGDDDTWDRTRRIVAHLPEAPSVPLALAALLYGVGGADPRVTALELARSLKLSNAERDRTTWLLDRRDALVDAPRLRPSRLKRLLASPGVDDLLALHRAVVLASYGDPGHLEYCEHYLRDEPDGPVDPPPLLTGHDLARMGLRPGPAFATLLDRVRDAQLDGEVTTQGDALGLVDRLRRAEDRGESSETRVD